MKLSLICFYSICVIGCATKRDSHIQAPINMPKPVQTKAVKTMNNNLAILEQTVDSADARVERLKILIDSIRVEQ
jgi:hypothetical protein